MLVRIPERDRVLLGPELVHLARQVDMGTLIREIASVRLGRLSEALGETVTLSVVSYDGGLDLVYQISGPQHLVPRSWTGQRFPLHASSSGKVLLSTFDDKHLNEVLGRGLPALTPHTITTRRALRHELDRVRRQGYAATVDELEEGLSGVSLGISAEAGNLLGTVNISGLSQRFDAAARERAIEQIRPIVTGIEAALRNGRGING